MWKMKRRRFVRMKLVSIPSSLFPLHPTYGPNPLVLRPPSSSPLPNIANHGTTSHRQPKSRYTTRTGPPPHIRLPKPHPMSPNIRTRLHRRSLTNKHPPANRPPKHIPPHPTTHIS